MDGHLHERVETAVPRRRGDRLHTRGALHAVGVVRDVRHVELLAEAGDGEQLLDGARREARGRREDAQDVSRPELRQLGLERGKISAQLIALAHILDRDGGESGGDDGLEARFLVDARPEDVRRRRAQLTQREQSERDAHARRERQDERLFDAVGAGAAEGVGGEGVREGVDERRACAGAEASSEAAARPARGARLLLSAAAR